MIPQRYRAVTAPATVQPVRGERSGFGTSIACVSGTCRAVAATAPDAALPALSARQNHQQDQDDAHSSSPGLCNGEKRR
ncbi:hypothetical protein [Xanthomonas sp. SS]|uniref:hypothetical protein n=1 Tax=Xanthomonas sp. SS TaxID=2724122 RepID=UPI00163A8853|nr:hypothetical protein [Xanthomonas sp. SS]